MIGTWVPGRNTCERRLFGSPALTKVSWSGGGAVGSCAKPLLLLVECQGALRQPGRVMGPLVLRIAESRLFVPVFTD